MMLANKCILRKLSSALLISTGVLAIIISILNPTVSPLLGVSMFALGASWLMRRELGLIAITIPALLGIEGLIGLATGIGLTGSLGLVWLAAIRFLEDYPRIG